MKTIAYCLFSLILGLYVGWSVKPDATAAPQEEKTSLLDEREVLKTLGKTEGEVVLAIGYPTDRNVYYDVADVKVGERWVYKKFVKDHASRQVQDAHVWFHDDKVSRIFFYDSDQEVSILD